MGNTFRSPTEANLLNDKAFADHVTGQQIPSVAPRTTASVAGSPQYAATSFTVSDILQGTFDVKDPSDTLLVINKALTQDLNGLYNLGADSLSSFSSQPGSAALSSVNNTASGGAVSGKGDPAAFESGGEMKESWVSALPTVNAASGALIWQKTGKASREMHLPTTSTAPRADDGHKQFDALPPNLKYPYYMDRQGGWIGGEDYTPGPVATGTIGGENANVPGHTGAFGLMTPEAEQFYCSMAWPYKGAEKSFSKAGNQDMATKAGTLKKSDYFGKKILVYSLDTKKGCVCTPGDWGPTPANSAGAKASIDGFIIGLSSDVHYVLGTEHGTKVMLGWVDDSTPVGPYTASTGGPNANRGDGGNVDGPLATGGGGQNTIEELIYAGNKVLNHPNCWLGKDGVRVPGVGNAANQFRVILSQGMKLNSYSNEVIYKDAQGRQFLVPALLNYMWYIMQGGFILDGYLGSIGHKPKAGDSSQISNHAHGGAIDIGSIGIASEQKVFSFLNKTDGRRVADKLFNYLSSLPPGLRGEEIGCSFEFNYPNNFRVYQDANPTHLHIGFDKTESGKLCNQLLKSSTSPGLKAS